MLYSATTASLRALEVSGHANALPTGRVVIAAEVPDTLSIEKIERGGFARPLGERGRYAINQGYWHSMVRRAQDGDPLCSFRSGPDRAQLSREPRASGLCQDRVRCT